MGSWAQMRKEIFNFTPVYPTYNFHPESVHSMIAKCIIIDGKISHVSYLPLLVNEKGQPELLKHDMRGQQTFDYVEKITKMAGLNARYEWDGDEVAIHT